MKYIILLICGLVVGFIVYTRPVPPAPVAKTIVLKTAPIERSGTSSVSETVYYLVAEDGSYARVSMGAYFRAKTGQKFAARYWFR